MIVRGGLLALTLLALGGPGLAQQPTCSAESVKNYLYTWGSIDRAIQNCPQQVYDDPPPHFYRPSERESVKLRARAELYLRKGDRDRAIADLVTAYKLFPEGTNGAHARLTALVGKDRLPEVMGSPKTIVPAVGLDMASRAPAAPTPGVGIFDEPRKPPSASAGILVPAVGLDMDERPAAPPASGPPAIIVPATAPATTAVPLPDLVAPAGRRVALVVGNSEYRLMPSLKNPRNDAVDVEASLKNLGFQTVLATDLDRNGMNAAVERFSRLAKGANVAVVYYSGHGMQFGGKNYLLPTDANLEEQADVNRYRLLPVDDLIEVLGAVDGLQLIILDACRNNPVERDFKNKVASVAGANRDVASTRGFVRMDARSGLIITYATAPNDVAADGIGRNSPFTQAFLKNISVPDMDIRQVLFRVQSEVYTSSGRKQLPEISSLYVGPEVRFRSSQK